MSKKHFEAIAKILKQNLAYNDDNDLISAFCDYFGQENPNFDRERFIKATKFTD